MLSHPLPLGEDGLGDPRGVFPPPRANPQRWGVRAGACSQRASRTSVRRQSKNAAAFLIPRDLCCPPALQRRRVRSVSEAHGKQRPVAVRATEIALLLLLSAFSSLLSSPSQGFSMPRGWEGWRHRFLGDGLRWLIPAPLGYIQHSDTSRAQQGSQRLLEDHDGAVSASWSPAPRAVPQPSPPTALDATTKVMESEGGVENKNVNQTNCRKSGPNLGLFIPVSAQSRSPCSRHSLHLQQH